MVQRGLTRDQKEEKFTAKSVAERTLENQLAFGKDRGKNIVAWHLFSGHHVENFSWLLSADFFNRPSADFVRCVSYP